VIRMASFKKIGFPCYLPLPPSLPPSLTSSKPFILLFTTTGPFESTQNRSLGGRERREGGREGGRAVRKARSRAANSE